MAFSIDCVVSGPAVSGELSWVVVTDSEVVCEEASSVVLLWELVVDCESPLSTSVSVGFLINSGVLAASVVDVEETGLTSNKGVVGPKSDDEEGSTSNTGESCAGVEVEVGCLSNKGVLMAASEVTEATKELGVEKKMDVVEVEGVDELEAGTSREGAGTEVGEVELIVVVEELVSATGSPPTELVTVTGSDAIVVVSA